MVTAQLGNQVEKEWLWESLDWFSFVDLRKSCYLQASVQHSADSQPEVAGAIAKIGAESDVGWLKHSSKTVVSSQLSVGSQS